MAFEIRTLQREDDRSTFDCGNEALNTFFRRFAHHHQFKHGISVTSVAVDGPRVGGFVTLTATTLSRTGIPSARSLPPLPLPAVLVARLGVDVSAAGQGLGGGLLAPAIRAARVMRRDVGCIGLLVDSKPEAIGFYRKHGFMLLGEPEVEGGSTRMYLPYESLSADN